MEKSDSSFAVTPTDIILDESDDIIRFSVKNKANKTCHFEIFVPDYDHFKIIGNRTFSLAPGISKPIKIQHCKNNQCTSDNSKIQVVDAFGNRNYVYFRCLQQKISNSRLIQLQQQFKLEKLKVNQQKNIEIPIKNVSQLNLRLQLYYSLPNHMAQKIQINMQENQMILLKATSKIIKLKIKMLKEAQVEFLVRIQCIEEQNKSKWYQQIKIMCNSLLRSQFIADNDLNRIDTIQHQVLNGTSIKGSLFLVNNYHQECPFKLIQIIQVTDYKTYYEKIEEITLKLEQNQGTIAAKSEKKINYQIFTKPNENDKNFTSRYAQLLPKDEVNSYKLKNSNYFRKNLDIMLKIQFGVDNSNYCKLKTHIINPAIRLSKTTQKNSQLFEVINDTGQQVPFKITNNLYFNASAQKGKLKIGANSLKIDWRKNQSILNTKQNVTETLRCCVKMEIPQNQITLYDPISLKRPKTALIRSQSVGIINKSSLRDKISLRAPTKIGDFGVKCFKEIKLSDYLQKANKYMKGSQLSELEFRYLQINQNQKGNVITNSHPEKNLLVYFPQKGYLLFETQHSYLIPYEKKGLKFELCGKGFQIKSKQIQDKQPYKIMKRQLLFCFSPNQKEFEVVKELQIVNRSNQFIMVYCLSIDDEFFHSLQPDNKILIEPKATNYYKLSFCPSAERRVKQRKITRNIEFLINDKKQIITCEGDFLPADISIDEKTFFFKNCLYSENQISKSVLLTNAGLNKVSYQIQHSQYIKLTPKSGVVAQKGKQTLTLSFRPSKLTKIYQQQIKILFKGSHVVKIPFIVNTLLPDIYSLQSAIDFSEGYLNQTLTAKVNIINKNTYSCQLNFHIEQTQLKGQKQVIVDGESTKCCQFKLTVKQVGLQFEKLPSNFIQLNGYGAIKGPKQIKITGKKTILQIIPDNPFKDLIFSQIQETRIFKIKNISQKTNSIQLFLKNQQKQKLVIVSCQPNKAQLYPDEQKQFTLHSIRADEDYSNEQVKEISFNLSIFMNQSNLYRSINFKIYLPPPELQINPQQIFFPLVCAGTWSKSSFTISNKGYKQVFIAIKRPSNVNFQFEYQFDKKENRLTKLNNKCEISLYFKSKKPISFGIVLQIQNNFGKKYQLKVYGTASRSPLLNCDRMGSGSSTKGFSSKQIKPSTCYSSLKSIATLETISQQSQSIRFFNKWIHGIFPESSKDNEHFNVWLKNPRHLVSFLSYLNTGLGHIPKQEMNISNIIQELKKLGYPLYTVQKSKLIQGNPYQWAIFIWYLLSKENVNQDCLKWVNKICGVSLETYDNAYNHHKKVLIDLLSRIMQPFFKAKVTEWQKIIEILQPSIPIITKIDNKRQFIFLLNILYNKFSKLQKQSVITTNLIYQVKIPSNVKESKSCWILGNGVFDHQLSPNCSNSKYIHEKKILSFSYEGEAKAILKLKEDIGIIVWDNSLYQSAKIIDISISKKPPISHNIVIQCQDKCSQQWKLQFICEIQAEYFFQFSGGMEFKCKMPDLGVIQAGEIMEFRVIYSPTNLKQHQGVLKICNKYEEHVYNLKGKPLKSSFIQIQKTVKVPQDQKWTETFSITQDPNLCIEQTNYKIQQLSQKTQQLKYCEARSNKKEIIIQIILQFTQIIQNKEIILRVTNTQLSFCRNIRLIVNVTPKPVIVQAQLKGFIEKTVTEKIPINNSLQIKQACHISIHKITKQQFLNFNMQYVNRDQTIISERGQWQYKLSHYDKVILKPKQTIKMLLSYLPVTLNQTCCQIRLKYDLSEQFIIYNFMGLPQLPCTDNPLLAIQCETEKQHIHTLKIFNKLKQKVAFDVETSLSFMAGSDSVVMQARQNYIYTFKLFPLHAGVFQGQLIFKSEKFCLVYPIKVSVNNHKKIRKIRVKSKIRVTSSLSIQLNNKSEKDIDYDVYCNSEYLKYDSKFIIPAKSQKDLILTYTPLFTGTINTQLKLYNQTMQQICYNLEMISQEHNQSFKYTCELGQKKKIKINIKNATNINAKILQPKLPPFLSSHSHKQYFPISLPAYSSSVLQLFYTQMKLENYEDCNLQLKTDLVGNYNFNLQFITMNQKIMPITYIPYDFHKKDEQTVKQFHLQLLNSFDQIIDLKLPTHKLQYNKHIKIEILNTQNITLKPYGTKHIKCQVHIQSYNLTQKDWQLQNINNKIQVISNQFKWIFPIKIIQVHAMKTKIQINGSSHELARTRVSLRHIRNLKNWEVSNLPQAKQIMNIAFLSSKDVYLQVIINKIYQYNGDIIFYDEDMICAEKYPLSIKVTGKKVQTVVILSNVGQKGRVDIKIKNGKGKFNVQLANNKMKQFDVSPKEGQFNDKTDNIIRFEYNPVEYNGSKKAEATITSESGSFSFLLVGKFPNLK